MASFNSNPLNHLQKYFYIHRVQVYMLEFNLRLLNNTHGQRPSEDGLDPL